MRVDGSWSGTWEQTWPSATERLPFQLHLHQSFLGRVRGTVTTSSVGGSQVSWPFVGRNLLGRLSLSMDMRSPTQHLPTAGVPLPPPPSVIECHEFLQEGLLGTWRTMTRWMVGPSRRIVPVVLAEGTWSVHRATSAQDGAA